MDTLSYLREVAEQSAGTFSFLTLQNATKQMTERYMSGGGSGTPLATSAAEIAYYAAVRMPATFSAVRAALRETLKCTKNAPRTLLDVGAGTGAATFAAAECMELQQAILLEREPMMIAYGQQLTGGLGLLDIVQWQQRDYTAAEIGCTADWVIASYTLNELSQKARGDAVAKLYAAANDTLLLVEPGTPEGFRQLQEARAALLKMGANIVAPCATAACGIQTGDWCHFTVRVARGKLHKRLKGGDTPYEDEKYCYLAVSKTKGMPAAARVMRHPIIQKGNIALTLCGDGGMRNTVVGKKDAEGFRFARKCGAGDTCPLALYRKAK